MASNRPVNLSRWGITFDEYKELQYFCRQYSRKKAQAEALITLGVSTPEPVTGEDGRAEFPPRSHGAAFDPVTAAVIKRERLLRDVGMIEKAAEIAGKDLAGYILRAVTTRDGARRVMMDCPCGRNQFYAMRRHFFWLLRDMKNGDAGAVES
ncbi:MAG: hypothetical protein Q4D04_08950 [Clostridia bacterium]|nr:hypothetical protein [Clostridia bacterium]